MKGKVVLPPHTQKSNLCQTKRKAQKHDFTSRHFGPVKELSQHNLKSKGSVILEWYMAKVPIDAFDWRRSQICSIWILMQVMTEKPKIWGLTFSSFPDIWGTACWKWAPAPSSRDSCKILKWFPDIIKSYLDIKKSFPDIMKVFPDILKWFPDILGTASEHLPPLLQTVCSKLKTFPDIMIYDMVSWYLKTIVWCHETFSLLMLQNYFLISGAQAAASELPPLQNAFGIFKL